MTNEPPPMPSPEPPADPAVDMNKPLSRQDERALSEAEYQALVRSEGEWWSGQGAAVRRSAFRRWLRRVGLEPDGLEYRSFGHFTLRMIAGAGYFRRMFRLLRGKGRVLEIGTHGGVFALELARRNPGMVIDAWDVAEQALQKAAAKYEDEKKRGRPLGEIRYALQDANRAPVVENEYDAIVVIGTLHHLMDIENVLRDCTRRLKPGGLLIAYDENEVPASENRRAAMLLSPLLLPVWLWKKRRWPSFQDLVELTAKLYEWKYVRETPFEEITEGAKLMPLVERYYDIAQRSTCRCLVDPLTRSMNILNKFIFGAPLKIIDRLLIWSGYLKGRSIFFVARVKGK